MNKISKLKEDLKIAQETCINFYREIADDEKWHKRFEQRQQLQNKFVQSWKTCIKNKEQFFEDSSKFAEFLQIDSEFQEQRKKLVDPYEQECYRLEKEITRFETQLKQGEDH